MGLNKTQDRQSRLRIRNPRYPDKEHFVQCNRVRFRGFTEIVLLQRTTGTIRGVVMVVIFVCRQQRINGSVVWESFIVVYWSRLQGK
jgi:hypothetical protein